MNLRAVSLTVFATTLALPALGSQIITLRSGQVGGLPGFAGQSDDIVTYLPYNPPGGQVSAAPFTAADFAGAVSGPAAQVINPHPAWTPGISDPLSRWINFHSDLDASGAGTGYGSPGSALYAVPFFVLGSGTFNAFLKLEYSVDDSLGDWPVSGPNPDGLYMNGTPLGLLGGGYNAPHLFTTTVTVNAGQNYLYFYQRDLGVLVSGLIFSAQLDITQSPAPGSCAILAMGGLAAFRRQRR